ncbi:hypothetical protein PIB30_069438 [Stylosanthes scabra]|uniref:Uncharacterized protein n=1 Tax=Stylosanthes scabra TaxID=79078 RepID=A0ABU6WN34_9FABA|nr:hypothetical protein [Stylosanthes scabra]
MSLICFCIFFFFIITVILASTKFDFGALTLSSLELLGDTHLNNGTVSLTRDLPIPTLALAKPYTLVPSDSVNLETTLGKLPNLLLIFHQPFLHWRRHCIRSRFEA